MKEIINFPYHSEAQGATESNLLTNRFNLFKQVAYWTPALLVTALVSGVVTGWAAKNWWEDNKGYLR